MPGYEILGFTGTWESTDALHCRTKGIADLGMLYIDHLPISGEVEAGLTCPVEASIVPYSGQSLISDSLTVHYRINEGSWYSVPLVHQVGSNYSASLPAAAENDQIAYYITAADSSGRNSSHPIIGRSDPHVFSVGPSMSNLQIEPDYIDCQLPADSTEMAWIKLTNNGSSRIQYSIETDSFRSTDAGNK